MNLILTDKCTNSCPYCFAAQEMSKDLKKNDMTRDNFNLFMDFIRHSKEYVEIKVIGGEPLIYHDIEYVISRLHRSARIKNICVMTGGIAKKNTFDMLLKYRKKMLIVFNVNEKASYLNPQHQAIVLENIEYAISLGYHVCIGFNIFHHGFDGMEIINLCQKFGISHLRFSVACPIYGSMHNTVVPFTEYRQLSNRVFQFLKDCFEAGIEANLDCPVPRCFFDEQQLGLIAKMHPQIINRLGKCEPPLDVNYDLHLLRCFSIGGYQDKKLTDFHSFAGIRKFFIREIDSRLSQPTVFPTCKTCNFKNSCNGGCLSNNQGFMNNPTKPQRIQNVLELAGKGNEKEAINRLEEERSLEDIDNLILAQLYYNVGNSEKALYHCRKALHESKSMKLSQKAVKLLKEINTII